MKQARQQLDMKRTITKTVSPEEQIKRREILMKRAKLIEAKRVSSERSHLVSDGSRDLQFQGPPPNNCEICLRYFKVPKWRTVCMMRHRAALDLKLKVTCPICNTPDIPKIGLNYHFSKEHGDLKSSCCCECLEVIKIVNGDELRKHILENHHTASEHYTCHHCGKQFSGKNTLNHHVKLIHEDKFEHQCKICGKKFSKGGNFTAHMASRSGHKHNFILFAFS